MRNVESLPNGSLGKPKLLVIVGPTASGKTALAIELAKKFGGEIVSADSRQIYRGMDIGTAKPPFSPASRRVDAKMSVPNDRSRFGIQYLPHSIPHHLIDIKDPDEDYTVADYKRDAIKAIRGILNIGKLPILVGGTGLYVKAVVENLDIPKVKENPSLRNELEADLKISGLDFLFRRLIALDPEAAYIIDPKNPRRVIRALEVAITTGKPFTAQRKKNSPLFDARIIGIKVRAKTIRERIDDRADEMIHQGLVEEVRNLYKKYGRVKALEAIGYREIIDYIGGKSSLDEAVKNIKTNTWHYAKRQITWFKKDKNTLWIDAQNAVETISAISEEFL
ncbi:MAG: tRNA (adenosine(37)-N6)-dimethylallyltransferase MiaA [Patescibacteria group bacterium]